MEGYTRHIGGSESDDERGALEQEAIAAEFSYRQQLDNLELREMIGDADHNRLIASV